MKDSWKYVSVWNNVKVIIFVLITFAFLFVPFAITEENGIIFTYTKLPVIGDGEIVLLAKDAGNFFAEFIQQQSGSIPSLLSSLYNVSYTLFLGILATDVIFCLILSLLRLNTLRIIMKILSIFCGFFMIIFAAINLIYVIGYFHASGSYAIAFFDMLKGYGVISAFVFFILGIIYSVKQFKWFSRP